MRMYGKDIHVHFNRLPEERSNIEIKCIIPFLFQNMFILMLLWISVGI